MKLSAFWKRESPALIVVANLASLSLALLSAPIVARAIGPDGRGQAVAAIAALTLSPIFLSAGVPLEVRRRAATGEGPAALRSARILMVFAFLPSVICAAILDLLVFGGLSVAGRVSIFLALTLTPASMVWICDTSFLVAVGRYRAVCLLRLTPPIIFVLLVVGFVWRDSLSVTAVVYSNLAGSLSTAAISSFLVRVSIRGSRMKSSSLLRHGIAFFGSSAAEAASSRLDQVVVLPLLGASQAGLYSVAATVGALPLALAQALGASYFRIVAAKPQDERRAAQSSAIRATSSLAVLSVLVLALLSPVAIPVIFGHAFRPAVQMTIIILVGSWAMVVSFVATMILAADSQGRKMTVAQIIALLFGLICLFGLGPPLGGEGAAVASSLSYILLLALLLRSLRLSPVRLLPSAEAIKDGFRNLSR